VYSVLKKLCDLQECGIIRARIGVNNESQLSKELIVFFYSKLCRQRGGKAPPVKRRNFVFRCQDQ